MSTTAAQTKPETGTKMAAENGTNGENPEPENRRRWDLEEVEGVLLPAKIHGQVRPMARHVEQLRQMKLRDDDVLLLTYAKAGTHWLWEVCSMLRQGKADYCARVKEQLMMEFVDVPKLEEQPSLRILNTHLPFCFLPVPEIRARNIKIVHVYRNPKDILVSWYFMAKAGKFANGHLEFPEFVDEYLRGIAPYGGYFYYLSQMHQFQLDNPEVPVFTVSFEDMKKDPVANITKLADFLEVDVSDRVCEEIADACSFQRMKEHAMRKEVQFGEGDVTVTSSRKSDVQSILRTAIFRKGETGDWKNYLTVAMSERMDALVQDKMKGLPFTFQYM